MDKKRNLTRDDEKRTLVIGCSSIFAVAWFLAVCGTGSFSLRNLMMAGVRLVIGLPYFSSFWF